MQSSLSSNKYIHNVMDDAILNVCSQEPSTSFNYPPFLTPYFWYTSNIDSYEHTTFRISSFGTNKIIISMISIMMLSSKTLVSAKCPSWHWIFGPLQIKIVLLGSNKIIFDIKDDPILHLWHTRNKDRKTTLSRYQP